MEIDIDKIYTMLDICIGMNIQLAKDYEKENNMEYVNAHLGGATALQMFKQKLIELEEKENGL